jgi:hypothetical protein
MDAPAENKDTIRERIVEELKARLEAMSLDQGDVVEWDEVVRFKLEDLADERVTGDVCAIFDITESYDYTSSCVECTLTVQVEWWVRFSQGEDVAKRMEKVRGNVFYTLARENQLLEADTGDRLTRLCRPVRYDKDVDGPRVDYGGAFLELTIIYRHRINDPHTLVGG